jgi:5-methyltetrahydrofolate--homocysteine methyltransferase
MGPLLERLRTGPVVIADGGIGTMLMARGLAPGDAPERLTLDAPAIVEEVARLYVEAGAEIVTTNTFGGSPLRLRAAGLAAAVERVNADAVAAALRAAGTRAWVSGSIGPTGHLLAPLGEADRDEVAEGFLAQAVVLAAAGVDLFCIETMTDLGEARLAVAAARRVADGRPVAATMTFEPTRRGFFTVMGVSIPQAAAALLDAGADIVGSNCGNGSMAMVEVARQFRAATAAPLLIQSNAGMPESRDGQLVYAETPDIFARSVAPLVAAGVAVIGGCCGTTPDHVRAMRAAARVNAGTADHPDSGPTEHPNGASCHPQSPTS